MHLVVLTLLLRLCCSAMGRLEWSQQKNFADNYEAAGVVSDANAGFGRNSKSDALQARSAVAGTLCDCMSWMISSQLVAENTSRRP